MPDPSCVPEFFGDTMLANGTVYPEATVEARRYRLRILNACNARFLNLQLYVDDGTVDSITLDPDSFIPTNKKGPDFLQIGTEGGFLPNPVWIPSNVPFDDRSLNGSLILAPAERADIIIDFSGFVGQKLILYNDARPHLFRAETIETTISQVLLKIRRSPRQVLGLTLVRSCDSMSCRRSAQIHRSRSLRIPTSGLEMIPFSYLTA